MMYDKKEPNNTNCLSEYSTVFGGLENVASKKFVKNFDNPKRQNIKINVCI